ncbi:unnamed protein product, partial [Arabidopsis halleri]
AASFQFQHLYGTLFCFAAFCFKSTCVCIFSSFLLLVNFSSQGPVNFISLHCVKPSLR